MKKTQLKLWLNARNEEEKKKQRTSIWTRSNNLESKKGRKWKKKQEHHLPLLNDLDRLCLQSNRQMVHFVMILGCPMLWLHIWNFHGL